MVTPCSSSINKNWFLRAMLILEHRFSLEPPSLTVVAPFSEFDLPILFAFK
jgi:hypothetical protein